MHFASHKIHSVLEAKPRKPVLHEVLGLGISICCICSVRFINEMLWMHCLAVRAHTLNYVQAVFAVDQKRGIILDLLTHLFQNVAIKRHVMFGLHLLFVQPVGEQTCNVRLHYEVCH